MTGLSLRRIGACLVLAGAGVGTDSAAQIGREAGRGDTVLVSAAVSLSEAMSEVAEVYERTGHGRIVLNLGPSNALARQIVAGAPVDLFISADLVQMDAVEHAGRVVDGSRIDLLSNQLVIVVPNDRTVTMASIRSLTDSAVSRIAIGDPDGVPAGRYARQLLESHGLWPLLEPKLVPTRSVRGALAAVEAGLADAAIVYRTDASASHRVRTVLAIPRATGPTIIYPAAVISTGENGRAARRLLQYLAGGEARTIFERHGFIVVGHDD